MPCRKAIKGTCRSWYSAAVGLPAFWSVAALVLHFVNERDVRGFVEWAETFEHPQRVQPIQDSQAGLLAGLGRLCTLYRRLWTVTRLTIKISAANAVYACALLDIMPHLCPRAEQLVVETPMLYDNITGMHTLRNLSIASTGAPRTCVLR